VSASIDYNSAGIGAAFQAAALGRVIVVRPAGTGGTQLTWFERGGQQTGTLGAPGDIVQPRLSPAGNRLAFTFPDPKNGNRDVWTIDTDRGIAAPLTRNTANDWHPVWSGDGKQMLFASDRGGKPETMLHIKTAMDAAAEEMQLLATFGSPTDWSRDRRWIAVDEYPLNQSGLRR